MNVRPVVQNRRLLHVCPRFELSLLCVCGKRGWSAVFAPPEHRVKSAGLPVLHTVGKFVLIW